MGEPVTHALALIHAEASRVVSAIVALAMKAPPPWAALLAGLGALYLFHGARHRRVLALPGGAVLGLATSLLLVTAAHGPGAAVPPWMSWFAGVVGALVCAGWPPAFPVLALAIPGTLIGWQYPIALHHWLGAVAGAAAGGAIGALLREWVASLAAGGIGAAAILAGGLGLFARQPLAGDLSRHPMVLLAAWTVLTVAGAAFHAGRAWPARRAGPGGEGPSPDDRASASEGGEPDR